MQAPDNFYLYSDNDATLHIAILDDQKQHIVVPPGSSGYFLLAPAAPIGVAQSTITPLLTRDTSGPYVLFNNDPPGTTWWYLDCLILHTDTVSLAPGSYYYEAKVNISGSYYTIISGTFTLKSSVITP